MRVFTGGEYRAKIIARMAGFVFGDVAIIVVQIANQGRIVEGCAVGRGFIPADQRSQGLATKVFDLSAQHFKWRTIQRADGATKRVDDADLELLACVL